MSRFEAVYHDEEPNERLAFWSVVEWTYVSPTNPDVKHGVCVEKFYYDGGEFDAVALAKHLNEQYAMELEDF